MILLRSFFPRFRLELAARSRASGMEKPASTGYKYCGLRYVEFYRLIWVKAAAKYSSDACLSCTSFICLLEKHTALTVMAVNACASTGKHPPVWTWTPAAYRRPLLAPGAIARPTMDPKALHPLSIRRLN
jgi:hypothetical protein